MVTILAQVDDGPSRVIRSSPFNYCIPRRRNEHDMLIKVKTLTGKEIELDIDSEDKISRIKEKVEEQSGVPPQQQRLIFGGRQMPDDKTAKDFNISAGSVLHLVLALRGGL
ncbi:hypothetical protein SCLCIDRAFT_1218288 [Scleroderma citrinum Foug A]|uniref:Ubiquitin-like domain-containing protein n=1 Tax=Scleroderma citrinum Foug A TaxID=1036808 RepID=A0A0C3DRA7_9AGAM|nr:hypothetical protein SCLCIDRAFT_1218288 [Scleroderma citrinum Foug A]